MDRDFFAFWRLGPPLECLFEFEPCGFGILANGNTIAVYEPRKCKPGNVARAGILLAR
jgi:hypothetical protein